jgi:dipeptidyl aminopeptidase/acylaminoacyl peptidase
MARERGRPGRTARAGVVVLAAAVLGATVAWLAGVRPVDWGAAAILHPMRRPLTVVPDRPYEGVEFASGGVRLEGWLFRPAGAGRGFGRGLVVYLHGIGDNRASGLGAARRLTGEGFAVLAFDARAHGRSAGDACTYGYDERRDVSAALDAVGAREAVLLGHSLGAATALQTAAVDRRVVGVIAASSFSDMTTIVRERARWFHLPQLFVDAAIARAGVLGRFPPAEASPVALAPRITAPVLLLHGADDWKTPPAHSLRIAGALRAPHRLVLVPGVGHDELLGRDEAWREIEAFLAGPRAATLPHAP